MLSAYSAAFRHALKASAVEEEPLCRACACPRLKSSLLIAGIPLRVFCTCRHWADRQNQRGRKLSSLVLRHVAQGLRS